MKTILYFYSGTCEGSVPTWDELQQGFTAYIGSIKNEKGFETSIGDYPVKVVSNGKNLEDRNIFEVVSTTPLKPHNFSMFPEVDPLAHMRC